MEQEENLREESARQREVYRETIAQERGLSTSLQEQLRQASEQISKLKQENGEMRAHVDATSGALLEAMAQEERVKEESAQQLAFAHERVEQEGAFVAALQEQLRSADEQIAVVQRENKELRSQVKNPGASSN